MVTAVKDPQAEAAKLAAAVRVSDKKLDSFRARRVELIKQFAGPYYGPQTWESKQPLNLLYSIASILEPTLAMQSVKASVTTRKIHYRPFGERMRLVLDYVLDQIDASGVVRELVREGLFSAGISKTALDLETGQPYVEPVSLDDYIIDHRCKVRKPGAYAYEGHRFRMSYEKAMDGKIFDAEAKEVLRGLRNLRAGSNRADQIAGQSDQGEDEFDPQIELIELWMPERNTLMWLPGADAVPATILREVEWYGHPDGPYDLLGYAFLPDNTMPLSVLAVIYDLYLLENEIACKIARQAKAQKDLFLVENTQQKDGQSIRDAHDGQVVLTTNAKGATVLSLGGANEKGYQALSYFQDFLTRISGNTDILGGLKAQSGTLGQDQMLMQGASVRTNDMRAQVYKLARNVVRKLAWYVWNDTTTTMDLVARQPGGIEIPVKWEPERTGQLTDFDFNIQVYGRAAEDPETRYMRIRDLISNVIAPLAPLAAQQGSYPDVDVLVNMAGRDLDIAEIEDVWVEGDPGVMPEVQMPGAERPSRPTDGMRQGAIASPVQDMEPAGATV